MYDINFGSLSCAAMMKTHFPRNFRAVNKTGFKPGMWMKRSNRLRLYAYSSLSMAVTNDVGLFLRTFNAA